MSTCTLTVSTSDEGSVGRTGNEVCEDASIVCE